MDYINLQYEDGEEIKQIWNPAFVVFAYIIAFLSSYAAVHLLDHGLWFWRSEELKKVAIIQYPDIYAACMIGFGTVWCMHFVGMAAVSLEGAPICYDWVVTLGSLGAVVFLIIAGIKVAGNDIFATPDRDDILDEILRNEYISYREESHKLRIISTYKLHFLVLGSFLAASGAVVMHYTGMMAQRGPFRKEWNIMFIAASVITAIVICFVGFWIIFRLRWKIQQLWLRLVSAAVIAAAVCGLHFFGMLSVTYYADNESTEVCQDTWDKSRMSPNAWTNHQIIVLTIGIVVIGIALLIEGVINQELIMAYEAAAKSSEIVTSLFPPQVRDRLLSGRKSMLRTLLTDDCEKLTCDDDSVNTSDSKPIADLFTDTTIMFADIAGFTAWSSQREPSQVFTLLEKIYGAFDEISQRNEVFKVETVGDCYVAASGLPNPREDHAVAMCQVARDCLNKLGGLTKKLEVALGPGTADLKLRVGLHSGPVTAGVLRGDRARFQLFGDTMNLASRMESTGKAGHIQISIETANLLKDSGKESWITPREELVVAKGKGELKTYWLLPDHQDTVSSYSGLNSSLGEAIGKRDRLDSSMGVAFSPKIRRVIKWNVDCLTRLLKNIAARRRHVAESSGVVDNLGNCQHPRKGFTVLDEVRDYIALPEIDLKSAKKRVDPETIELDEAVTVQLYEYVSALAAMYRSNPFHNFEHASHVTMSVSKLLSRIVAPSEDMEQMEFRSSMDMTRTLHDHTYGITSDPLTQFACVLSGLIHDVDHTGVPNTQLIKENPSQAAYYKGRSVAEQNSVDLAWNLLMEDQYSNLRAAIYTTETDFRRFRQLVVNCVMATDIMDKELKALRNARWEKAFSENAHTEDPRATVNRKATIVIEHLIQASDVAHTMQHWHVYTMWNERLFQEMMLAWQSGRADRNPAEFWYEGEIGFFDFYIIPLAKKLKECGVFGVSSDEYLNYAVNNRMEWEKRGKQVVAEMTAKFSDTQDTFSSQASQKLSVGQSSLEKRQEEASDMPLELLSADSTTAQKPNSSKLVLEGKRAKVAQEQRRQSRSLQEEIQQIRFLLAEKLKLDEEIQAKEESIGTAQAA